MANNNLGKIKKIELRKVWNNEASDFTNWLAEEENLRLLSDEIGIDINLIQTEASVGKFKVDILGEEENIGKKIIIENQLEATNHDHLGKIITYASGHEANTVIWVVKEAREEHRQAIDWLNDHTDADIAFFLIQVELWQIDASPFAPKFEIISKPNDWARTVKQSVRSGKLTDTAVRQLEFWGQFETFAKNHQTILRIQKPSPRYWLNTYIGSKYAHILLTLNSFYEVIRTGLYIQDNKEVYYFLEQRKDEVEKELDCKVEWMELQGQKASHIKAEFPGLIDNTEEWEKYFAWLQETAEKFQKVFSKLLKKYK